MIFRSLLGLYYLPRYSLTILAQLQASNRRAGQFLRQYWQTQDFSAQPGPYDEADDALRGVLLAGMGAQIVVGLLFIFAWERAAFTAGVWFGLALIVSYPLVWAHVLALYAAAETGAYYITHPKKLGRAIVCRILERQVRHLRAQHEMKVVAVVGSVGKTSTKLAIASLLARKYRIQYQEGNYNDRVTVPLIFFGSTEPSLLNIPAWFKLFRANAQTINEPYPYDVVVAELGTDGPGFMREFAYLRPDIAVVTAITEEHMEYFKTLDAVAAEELAVFDFAKTVLINADDIPGKYLAGRNFLQYSTTSPRANYYTQPTSEGLQGQTLDIIMPRKHVKAAKVQYIGHHGAKFALAAAAVGDLLDMTPNQIKSGLQHLKHFAGRMQVLPGLQDSTLIDDTYNASPVAVKAALDVLYAAKAPQRIAILGSMNELGDYSKQAHQEVGAYCEPKKLNLVITIGKDAEKWLAPAAQKRGCEVKSFQSPYAAGKFVLEQMKTGSAILAKGSQNSVFAEEALKSLLADQADTAKLVRQSDYWLRVKHRQFND